MSEYWVSKKQYWCKYCDIYIRDDAPSRRLHESGLKHQGNKERYIRDLYKTGNQAKRDKEEATREMQRIEAAANKAFANDIGSSHSAFYTPKLHPSASASSSRPAASADKFANYSTAEQLGLADETPESAYDIEKAIGTRPGRAGEWEEVDAAKEAAAARARGLQRAEQVDEDKARAENWKLRGEKRERELYGDDEWDPKAAVARIRLKKVEAPVGGTRWKAAEAAPTGEDVRDVEGGLKREGWSGKIELGIGQGAGVDGSGGGAAPGAGEADATVPDEDVKPPLDDTAESKPELQEAAAVANTEVAGEDVKLAADAESEAPAAAATSSLFKKRRPPPSGRKK